MSQGKFDTFRVDIELPLSKCATSFDEASLCAKFVLNNMTADELMSLIKFKDKAIDGWKDLFSNLVLIENFTTEQFCYFYMALWAIDRLAYYDRTSTDPVTLRFNEELVNKIIHEVFINGEFGDTTQSSELSDAFAGYPAAFKPRSNSEMACMVLFSDLWSRATNQVIPLSLLLLTN